MDKEKALTLLKKHGFKMTNRREEIINFFLSNDKYKTAKQLYIFMEGLYPGISFDTVYRNLRLYDELGILESTELQAERYYRIRCATHHHHHFICSQCGKSKKINICPMELHEIKQTLAAYEITDHRFEVYGHCPTCQSA